MNRLRILLITSALIAGSSALASAQEPYKAGFAVQVRLGEHDGNKGGAFFYGRGDRDDRAYFNFHGDRDDRYIDRDDRYRHHDRDDRWRWRKDDDRRGRDFDHDGDRR